MLILGGYLDASFWLLNFCHSSLIANHSKIPRLFGTITHFPSFNIFHTICGPHTCHLVQFFFFFFKYPNSPNLVKKKKKKKERTEPSERTKTELNLVKE